MNNFISWSILCTLPKTPVIMSPVICTGRAHWAASLTLIRLKYYNGDTTSLITRPSRYDVITGLRAISNFCDNASMLMASPPLISIVRREASSILFFFLLPWCLRASRNVDLADGNKLWTDWAFQMMFCKMIKDKLICDNCAILFPFDVYKLVTKLNHH